MLMWLHTLENYLRLKPDIVVEITYFLASLGFCSDSPHQIQWPETEPVILRLVQNSFYPRLHLSIILYFPRHLYSKIYLKK